MSLSHKNTISAAQAIHQEISAIIGPPEEGFEASTQKVILISLVRGTRGYIEKIANQINGCYENGWYDACAVMIRRLVETLIIEAFEKHNVSDRIKNQSGDFLYLRDLIDRTIGEPSWNLSRNARQALPKLKEIGDKSAHSRRYVAQRGDLQTLLMDIRKCCIRVAFYFIVEIDEKHYRSRLDKIDTFLSGSCPPGDRRARRADWPTRFPHGRKARPAFYNHAPSRRPIISRGITQRGSRRPCGPPHHEEDE